MFTAESAIDLRSEAYDERIRDAVYTSTSDRSATIGIWFSKFDNADQYKQAVSDMITALIERGFSNIESAEHATNSHHHRTIISFCWARLPTKADPVVMAEYVPQFRVTDREGTFIDLVRIDDASIMTESSRRDLKQLRLDEKHAINGYIYTRVR